MRPKDILTYLVIAAIIAVLIFNIVRGRDLGDVRKIEGSSGKPSRKAVVAFWLLFAAIVILLNVFVPTKPHDGAANGPSTPAGLDP
jgi:hypothetical protein